MHHQSTSPPETCVGKLDARFIDNSEWAMSVKGWKSVLNEAELSTLRLCLSHLYSPIKTHNILVTTAYISSFHLVTDVCNCCFYIDRLMKREICLKYLGEAERQGINLLIGE